MIKIDNTHHQNTPDDLICRIATCLRRRFITNKEYRRMKLKEIDNGCNLYK